MGEDKKRIGVIYVYQDSDNESPYIKGKDNDDISYITELEGEYKYLNKYIENPSFPDQIQRIETNYSIFNEEKTLIARFVSFLMSFGLFGVCILLFYSLQRVSIVWHTSLEEKKIGAMLGYSCCFSLVLFGFLIAGILVLAFLNYTFSRKKEK